MLLAATTASYAYIMQPLVDRVFVNRDPGMLLFVPIAVLVVGAIKAVATYVQAYLMGVFGQRIIADIQNSMYAHIIRSDLAFFHSKATGGLLASFLITHKWLTNSCSASFC